MLEQQQQQQEEESSIATPSLERVVPTLEVQEITTSRSDTGSSSSNSIDTTTLRSSSSSSIRPDTSTLADDVEISHKGTPKIPVTALIEQVDLEDEEDLTTTTTEKAE